jgi:hypothetical protein
VVAEGHEVTVVADERELHGSPPYATARLGRGDVEARWDPGPLLGWYAEPTGWRLQDRLGYATLHLAGDPEADRPQPPRRPGATSFTAGCSASPPARRPTRCWPRSSTCSRRPSRISPCRRGCWSGPPRRGPARRHAPSTGNWASWRVRSAAGRPGGCGGAIVVDERRFDLGSLRARPSGRMDVARFLLGAAGAEECGPVGPA